MNSILNCPTCAAKLHFHESSKGYYCDNKHHFDKNAQGYWSFVTSPKFKGSSESRDQLRSKRFLMASGIFAPLTEQLSAVFNKAIKGIKDVNHLNYQCADGFYLRSIAQSADNDEITHWGVSEANNALFAASKDNTPANLLLSPFKKLPFSDQSLDVVTLFDAQLKGKECLRILKKEGVLLMLVPAPRHLWQLKQKIYDNLSEKPQQLNLPKDIELIESTSINFTADVTGEQAMTLLDMNNLGWRINDELKHDIKQKPVTGLEFDYLLLTAKVK
ncbi:MULTISPECIES: class I SAM-dependent methyltransferase [Shewanella]|uniref:SAM-dependent methyltransferase n=1 Tax=Shewanella TaxID=22 RepID=UPI001BBC5AEC|nr:MULTISPECIES: SAM-dependent methyltransferase [Shewanella]GIU47876.1 SAM-dependent methyltransferase [Shewanella sp. KT0246]